MTVAPALMSGEATATPPSPARYWKCPYGCAACLAVPVDLWQHLNIFHANDSALSTWLARVQTAWLSDPQPENRAPERDAADAKPPSSDASTSTSSTTPTTREQILASITANLHEREAGQRARAELPQLLAHGRSIPGLTITEMARAAGITRQTAHELVREAGDVDYRAAAGAPPWSEPQCQSARSARSAHASLAHAHARESRDR